MNARDETVLAKFAAGDMSTAEETEFLACCEIEPDLWRAAALALVEHRQFTSALREFAGDRSGSSINSSGRTADYWKTHWPTMLAVAASLLVVMLGGSTVAYWAGQHQRNDVLQVRQLPDGAVKTPDSPIVVYVQPPRGRDLPQAAPPQAPTIPSNEALAAQWAAMNSRPVFPEEARALLRQVGVEVEEEPRLHILDDGSGQRWAVPERNFQLRCVNDQD